MKRPPTNLPSVDDLRTTLERVESGDNVASTQLEGLATRLTAELIYLRDELRMLRSLIWNECCMAYVQRDYDVDTALESVVDVLDALLKEDSDDDG